MEDGDRGWASSRGQSGEILDLHKVKKMRHDDDVPEVVISGLSGRLPECSNMNEFRDNLYNGVDMVTEDDRRWPPGIYDLPKRNGKLKELDKFDASFFGIAPKHAEKMDPQLRMLLEVTHEAIVDAGVNPHSVRGTRTGVFVGTTKTEAWDAYSNDPESLSDHVLLGGALSMFANRISYAFDLQGPSLTMDTACSSSLMALNQALVAIRTGQCDAAIVAGSAIVTNPIYSLQFKQHSMLSPDGTCKSFDESADGYVRSEAVMAIYVQKASNARRVYATVVHAGNNSDGHTEEGITFPNGELQKQLLQDVYQQCGIDPAEVGYIEAHGTGTKAGDPQELNAIADVFCNERRKTPLLIGSVKSNMGHAEPVSGLAAIAKVLISMERREIPANLFFKNPNPDIACLHDGSIEVACENRPFPGIYAAVNSFGFGGTNVHVLLKTNTDEKHDNDHQAAHDCRLITFSARSPKGLEAISSNVKLHSTDVPFQALIQATSTVYPSVHPYRGYQLLNSEINPQQSKVNAEQGRPVWFVFSGMGSQWPGMGKDLLSIDAFKQSLETSDAVLRPYGFQLLNMIQEGCADAFKCPLNSFVAIAAIQVALVDILRCVGVHPDGIVGHSVGELACAYADGALTAAETVLAAYWRGRCVVEAELPVGTMAAVGLTWEEATRRCPEGVVPACHNTSDTITISGNPEAMEKFTTELKEENIFVRNVDSSNIAFHSPVMKQVAPSLQRALGKVIKENRRRSKKWISTSVSASQWDSTLAAYSSAEYHVHNLLNPVLFNEALQYIPHNAVTIEIGPHCLLQAILKRALSKDCIFVSLMRKKSNNVEHMLKNLGELHASGINLNPMNLHASVRFPVPSGTPMLSPLIKWNHSKSWPIPSLSDFLPGQMQNMNSKIFAIDTSSNSDDHYLLDHMIDGRSLFPAAGYLVLAWRTLAQMHNCQMDKMKVVFENVQFIEPTMLPSNYVVTLRVSIQPGIGSFGVTNDAGTVVAKGVINVASEEVPSLSDSSPSMDGLLKTAGACMNTPHCSNIVQDKSHQEALRLTTDDIYTEFKLKGFQYGPAFQNIESANNEGTCGYVKWTGRWVAFLDNIMQFVAFKCDVLHVPTRITSMTIDPLLHLKMLQAGSDIFVERNYIEDKYTGGGVQLFGLHINMVPRQKVTSKPIKQAHKFVPYFQSVNINHGASYVNELIDCAKQLSQSITCLEANDDNDQNLKQLILDVLNRLEGTGMLSQDSTLEPRRNGKNLEVTESSKVALQVLKDVMMTSKHDRTLNALRSAIANSASAETEDIVLGCLKQPDILNSFLLTAHENRYTQGNTQGKIKIVEYGNGQLYKLLLPWLQEQPKLGVNYIIVTPKGSQENDLQKLVNEGNASVCQWDYANAVPNGVGSADLVVMDELIFHSDLPLRLKMLVETVKIGGFVLLTGATNNHSLALLMRVLFRMPSEYSQCHALCHSEFWNENEAVTAIQSSGLNIVSQASSGLLDSMYLCRKLEPNKDQLSYEIDVSSIVPTWVDDVKRAHATHKTIWFKSLTSCNGVMGMVNCIRRETGGENMRCIMICDENIPEKDIKQQKTMDLFMNVYMNGNWGHYILLPLNNEDAKLDNTKHAYVNVETRGDLSSLKWIESPLKYFDRLKSDNLILCEVHYASINFRDVMLATGRLPPDAIPKYFSHDECMLGLEFTGTDSADNRVMGLVPAKALAKTVAVGQKHVWPVPDAWTLLEASSVPMAYCTAYYALEVRGRIQQDDVVLIHSGSGAVGQAAIAIALHHGCTVFTTVSSPLKIDYLKKRFPQLNDDNFAQSRNTSFEGHIKRMTNGRGCDIVLNSLAEDKLKASLRCVAEHGCFLEIGKYDLAKNTDLGMAIFLKNVTFHGILLDAILGSNDSEWHKVARCFDKGMNSGVVQPLQTTVFDKTEVEEAFRYMAKGTHIGKVVLEVYNPAFQNGGDKAKSTGDSSDMTDKDISRSISVVRRTHFDPTNSFIVTGGLGGFGLQLTQWLIDRGARKIILTSRSGVTTGYQSRCIRIWNTRPGIQVNVCINDITTEEKTKKLIGDAECLGDIGGIFHLAMVLQDKMIDNQSFETFCKAFAPKVNGTKHLDCVTRKLCSKTLEWFVVFSSAATIIGGEGMSNYGFANSYMERICEMRKKEGLPGIAIQWGSIGDIGIMMETFGNLAVPLVGTQFLSMRSCLASLDSLLTANQAVVCNYLLADTTQMESTVKENKFSVVESVCRVLGISDIQSIHHNASLAEMGADSLMAMEIKLIIERATDVVLTTKEIRNLTFYNLANVFTISSRKRDVNPQQLIKDILVLPKQTFRKLKSKDDGYDGPPLFVVHDLFGTVNSMEPIASFMKCDVYGIEMTKEAPSSTLEELAEYYVKKLKQVQSCGPYYLAGYSLGASIVLAMNVIEPNIGTVFALDGSPDYSGGGTDFYNATYAASLNEAEKESKALCMLVTVVSSGEFSMSTLYDMLVKHPNRESRMKAFVEHICQVGNVFVSGEEELESACSLYCHRIDMMNQYKVNIDTLLNVPCVLVKAAKTLFEVKLDETYGLKKVYADVTVETVPGNHFSFVHESAEMTARIISKAMP